MKKLAFLLLFSIISTPSWAAKYKDPELAGKINPHWTDQACQQCHLGKPSQGKKATFKFGGDFNKLCNSCHDTAISRFDEHVVGVLIPDSPYFRRPPQDFPLDNGKLTCITCHDVRIQEAANPNIRDKNPPFLRRAPFEIERTFEWARSEIDERYRQSRFAHPL